MSETAIAINADVSTFINFELQYLNNQASDHPGSYIIFDQLFTLFQAIVSVFNIALLQI